MMLRRLAALVVLAGLLAGCEVEKYPGETPGATPGPAPLASEPDPQEPPAPERDQIKADLRTGRIEVTGRFCLEKGILDYLAVQTGGQEYESVVAMDGRGSLIHQWLLAFGAVPGPTQDVLDAIRKNPPKDMKIPDHTGTALTLTLEWERDGKTVSVPASKVLYNRRDKKVQAEGGWTFTGSYFGKDIETEKEFYMADIERTLVGVVYSGAAVINFDKDAGNPYSGEDEGYEINSELVPPKGTPVKLVITLAKP